MKTIFTSVFLFVLSFGAISQVSTDQYSVITKVSADWCTLCGGWAWNAFEDMRDQLADKNAIYVMAHHTGGLSNEVSTAWADNLNHQGQPRFFMNNDLQSINSNNVPTVTTSIGEQIDLLASLGAFAGVQGQGSVTSGSNKLYANVDVEFFSELQGEYFLGVYTVQNNVIANQASQGVVQQPKLLTGAFTDDWFGVPLTNTTDVQSFEFEIDQPQDFSSADGDTEILSVIWNKLPSGAYVFFNASVNGTINSTSNTIELGNALNQMKAGFNGNQLKVKIDAAQKIDDARLIVRNIVGQNVSSKLLELNKGDNSVNMDNLEIPGGLYILTLEAGDQKISQKVYK